MGTALKFYGHRISTDLKPQPPLFPAVSLLHGITVINCPGVPRSLQSNIHRLDGLKSLPCGRLRLEFVE